MASQRNFRDQRERSKVYEIAMSGWLQSEQGYYILPSYDYSGLANDKAPRLVCGKEWLVLPDLQAYHWQHKPKWFEVKVKEQAIVYRKTGDLETGIATRHLRDYRRVKALTKTDVWLTFVHEKEGVVRRQEIDDLPFTHVYDGDLMDKGGTTFFDFNRLPLLMTLAELNKFRQG